jgi:hypothetical protein
MSREDPRLPLASTYGKDRGTAAGFQPARHRTLPDGNPARVDCTADVENDGTLIGNVLRHGSVSRMTTVKQ